MGGRPDVPEQIKHELADLSGFLARIQQLCKNRGITKEILYIHPIMCALQSAELDMKEILILAV